MQEALVGIHELHSNYWSKAEFYVAMRRGNVPRKLASRNLTTIGNIVLFSPVTSDQIDDALNLIYELHLHAADATHIAACRKLGCEAMVSDDEHLTRPNTRDYLDKQGIKLVSLTKSA